MGISMLAASAMLLMTAGAFAQNATQPDANGPAAQTQPPDSQTQSPGQAIGNGPIGQQVKQKLEQAGFSDVTVVPNSFVIQARNREGTPVMMLIDADSMTAMELRFDRNDSTVGQSSPSSGSGTPNSTPSGSAGSGPTGSGPAGAGPANTGSTGFNPSTNTQGSSGQPNGQ